MMTHWYVKDFSKLTKVSVQTLHYYDKIELLKPSIRLDNGYRLYSEADLLKLQQVLALKFFGFGLMQIKTLLAGNVDMIEHFTVQSQLLQKQAMALIDASKVLQSVISDRGDDKSISWEIVIKLIEVYQMTQQLEHSWVKDIFTPEELKQYAAFETEWKNNSTAEHKSAFEKNWANLVEEINSNLGNNPESAIGITLGEKCMSLINGVYGKKYAHLRTKKFEKVFGEGKGLEEVGLTSATVAWLDKAIDAYWHNRIYGILNKVGTEPHDALLTLWNDVLDDMYGEDNARKVEIYNVIFADEKINQTAKDWLKKL